MLKIYNTLTRQKEEFNPLKENEVSFYYCGPTVYWTQHIGNMRGLFCTDIIIRTLKHLGYKVKSVRNYTDVGHLTSDQDEGEDKIEEAAKKEELTPRQITQKYIEIYENDAKDLNILEPSYKPKATECVGEIIEMIQILIDQGHAYKSELAVYFDISKYDKYNQLSGQNLEEQIKGAGKGEVDDPNKKNPADFVLWFFKTGKHKKALQYWPSPFESPLVENGEGFPGWHIECSVMAKKYLGKTVDIHMGGIEHIPIHHTNEIAQSESANQAKFVNYWIHNEHLLMDNKKMSKSVGNVLTLNDIKEKGFNPLALRYLFLQAHYRSKQNFTWQALEAAQKGYDHLISQIKGLGDKEGQVNQEFKKEFTQKMSNDFNSPLALTLIQNVLKSDLDGPDKLSTLLDFDNILGLNLDEIEKKETPIPQEIKKLVLEREKARKEKNFEKSDRLRKEIEEKGYQIEDTSEGSKLSPKS